MPLTLRQQDKLQTIIAKLDTLVGEVAGKDGKVDYELGEALRRLTAAAREASGDWR